MAKRRLTDRTLKSLDPAKAGQRYDVFDTDLPGFGVRVYDKVEPGSKNPNMTFFLMTRFGGSANPARRSIGTFPALTLADARETARDWLEKVRKGIDPRDEVAARKLQQQRQEENTFRAVAEDFIRLAVVGPNEKKPKQRKGLTVARELRSEFVVDRRDKNGKLERQGLGDRPIESITAQDIIRVLDDAVERGAEYQAHNLLGHVRRMFNWAIARGVYGIDRSPCDRMKPADVIGKKALRSRVLRDEELRALWNGAEKLGYPFGPLFQLLALTGQRKSEVAEARWREFDLEKRLWIIPPERMKGDAPHVVPLTDQAIRILEDIPRFEKGDYLFSTTFGAKPVNGFSKAKVRLDKSMFEQMKKPLEPFVIHDIRRTMRTGLSALPIPDMVRELMIAHARPGLHKVYDQHAYLDEKRQGFELWGARLRSIVTPPPANVVELKARA
jgi:integrase